MRVYPRKDFLKLPAGTLFSYYDKKCVAELSKISIKLCKPDGTWNNDFITQRLNEFESGDGDHMAHLCSMDDEIHTAFKSGNISDNYPIGDEESHRDAMFDEEAMFAVYDDHDKRVMLGLLLGLDTPTYKDVQDAIQKLFGM